MLKIGTKLIFHFYEEFTYKFMGEKEVTILDNPNVKEINDTEELYKYEVSFVTNIYNVTIYFRDMKTYDRLDEVLNNAKLVHFFDEFGSHCSIESDLLGDDEIIDESNIKYVWMNLERI